ELARKNPDTYLPSMAGTLKNLGVLHRDQNRMAEARQGYEEALAIYQRFAERDPQQFRAGVARVERLFKAPPRGWCLGAPRRALSTVPSPVSECLRCAVSSPAGVP